MFSTTGGGHPASRSLGDTLGTHTVAGVGPPDANACPGAVAAWCLPGRDTASPVDPSGGFPALPRGDCGGCVGSVRPRGPVVRN
ncbi:MAG TPA: hypothetical protein VK784_04140 [Pseudonocardiaceae bacterium]|nr:hypothetical protein [Pseudonocardiaceae bacterium]